MHRPLHKWQHHQPSPPACDTVWQAATSASVASPNFAVGWQWCIQPPNHLSWLTMLVHCCKLWKYLLRASHLLSLLHTGTVCLRHNFPSDKARQRLRPQKCFWQCGENFGTRAKRRRRPCNCYWANVSVWLWLFDSAALVIYFKIWRIGLFDGFVEFSWPGKTVENLWQKQ